MRKIEPYFDNAPPELWNEASKNRNRTVHNPRGESKIQLALRQKSKHEFDREVYAHPAVKSRLKDIFKGKCAFCETNTHAGAHKDVEHFRFKDHYYWLGYEWSNLLLSCQICNRNFKKTQFPIENEAARPTNHPLDANGNFDREACHILNAPALLAEQPLLLHPAIDNPKDHLQFQPDGSVEGTSPKGLKSVEVYGLKRDYLVKARKEIILEIQKDIAEEYQHNPLPDDERIKIETRKAFSKLIARINNLESEYIGYSIAILEEFESFIIDNTTNGIDLPNKETMRQAIRAIRVF